MRVYTFLFEPTQQWLNYDNIRGLYRGVKSQDSNWEVHEVHEVQECYYILRHVGTGATFANLKFFIDGDRGYKISVSVKGYQEGIVLDTNAYDDPDSDKIIFWNYSDNPVNTNQTWKIVLNTDLIHIYNIDVNGYLTITDKKFAVNNLGNNSVDWMIKDNVFRHIASKLQHKSLRMIFVTPLDIRIMSNGALVVDATNHIRYVTDPQQYQAWRLLPSVEGGGEREVPLVPQVPSTLKQTLSVLTLNVQSYTSASREVIGQKLSDINQVFNGIDVICLQEDFYFLSGNIPGFTRVSVCEGEKYFNNDNLANSIWVNNLLLNNKENKENPRSLDITSGCLTPRCVSSITVKGISIANTHLCGGRIDDPDFEQLLHVKEQEVTDIVENIHPDIILGDFNAGYNMASVEQSLSSYSLYKKLSESQKKDFLIFFRAVHDTIRRYGYEPAYDETNIPSTSVYGGLPDWVYYLKNKLVPVDIRMVDFISDNLSDHNAVYVKFNII